MKPSKWETVNPNFHRKALIYSEVVRMDDFKFPSRPDDSLKGSRYLKRQMVPEEDEKQSPSSPRESFLWKDNDDIPKHFESHFDHKSFHEAHAHLLPGTDQSGELEKNLRNRRKHLGTISSIDSKFPQPYTSADEIQVGMDIQSPCDELTYEETLFEVDDDRMPIQSPTSQEEDESELTSPNRSMVFSMNRRKRQKINDKQPDLTFQRNIHRSLSGSRSGYHRNQPIVNNSRPNQRKFLNDSINSRISHQSRHVHRHSTSGEESIEDFLSENVLEEYIQERIRAVELQIRNEVMRGTQNTRRSGRRLGFNGGSLLDKVPEQYSVELEQADESSRDSLLKEIAAVLVSKGYVANADESMTLPKELAKITREKASRVSSCSKFESIENEKSNSKKSFVDIDREHSKERKKHRRQQSLPPPLTFRSQSESSRNTTSLNSSQSSLKKFKETKTSETAENRKKKLKSCGSRSSLTSLIRTPDSSSSSDDNTVRRNGLKRPVSSSVKSSILSNDSTDKPSSKEETGNSVYDNILFFSKNDAGSECKQNIIKKAEDSESPSDKVVKLESGKNSANAADIPSASAKFVNSDSQSKSASDATKIDHLTHPIPLVCPPPPTPSISGSSNYQVSNSGNHKEELDSSRPAPPPRRKIKSRLSVNSGIGRKSSDNSSSIGGNYTRIGQPVIGIKREESMSATSMQHGDRSAPELFVVADRTRG